jgi:peptidoglycan hydrolase-like protein with peptidoglycan-binding domain
MSEDIEQVVEVAPAKPVKPAEHIKYATPVAVTLEDIAAAAPEPAGPAVVGLGTVDNVSLSSIIFKNIYARKSLSVHHMQRRLSELGYIEAARDKDGYYGDSTKEALARFQGDNNMLGAGVVDMETLELLFTNDPNVTLIP